MNKIYYGKFYPSCTDYQAESIARELLDKNVYTSNELVILATRVLIKEGYLDNEQVEIVYVMEDDVEIKIPVDKDGRIETKYWVKGFCDYCETLVERLL